MRRVVNSAFTFSAIPLLILTTCLTGCAGSGNAERSISVYRPIVKSAAFVSSEHAWLVTTEQGTLLTTKDGGISWMKVLGKTVGNKFESISFIDATNGLASNSKGEIWRTTDGGRTWTAIAELSVPQPGQWQFMSSRQMRFIDPSHAWLVETFTIWRTSDGGITWRQVFSVSDREPKGQPGRAFFLNSDIAWVSNGGGELYKTSDGGNSWQQVPTENNLGITNIFFINERKGWFSAFKSLPPYAKIYRTDDGGKTWLPRPIPNDEALIESIHFISEQEGWCAGRVWTGDPKTSRGIVFHSVDGGQHWEQHREQILAAKNEPLFDRIYFDDAQHGWLFGQDKVYRTEDGGKTWRTVLTLSSVNKPL